MAIEGMFFDAIESGGTYDREYSSGDFSRYLELIVGNGVFPNPSTQLQVRADSGLNIIVGQGQGWIDGHKLINTADLPMTLDAADALLNRIDRVIFFCDYTTREMGITVLKGTPAASAQAPALTRTYSRYEMSLALITINKQTTAITNAMITDTRADSAVCGWATGIIQQVDTSTLFQQWQTAYANYYADVKQQLDDFMAALTQELRVNTYVVQFKKIVSLTSGSGAQIVLDMTDYTYENTDIIDVYINGLKAIEGTNYSVSESGGVATVNVNVGGSSSITNVVEVRVFKSVIGITEINP